MSGWVPTGSRVRLGPHRFPQCRPHIFQGPTRSSNLAAGGYSPESSANSTAPCTHSDGPLRLRLEANVRESMPRRLAVSIRPSWRTGRCRKALRRRSWCSSGTPVGYFNPDPHPRATATMCLRTTLALHRDPPSPGPQAQRPGEPLPPAQRPWWKFWEKERPAELPAIVADIRNP